MADNTFNMNSPAPAPAPQGNPLNTGNGTPGQTAAPIPGASVPQQITVNNIVQAPETQASDLDKKLEEQLGQITETALNNVGKKPIWLYILIPVGILVILTGGYFGYKYFFSSDTTENSTPVETKKLLQSDETPPPNVTSPFGDETTTKDETTTDNTAIVSATGEDMTVSQTSPEVIDDAKEIEETMTDIKTNLDKIETEDAAPPSLETGTNTEETTPKKISR